jgi:hypothetical protein
MIHGFVVMAPKNALGRNGSSARSVSRWNFADGSCRGSPPMFRERPMESRGWPGNNERTGPGYLSATRQTPMSLEMNGKT